MKSDEFVKTTIKEEHIRSLIKCAKEHGISAPLFLQVFHKLINPSVNKMIADISREMDFELIISGG